jgi:hypothetical protein
MTPVTNALSSKEASPNEKGQISSINTWQSYGFSYNKWMKKGLFVARKRDEKEKPSPQQQVDEKERSSFLPFPSLLLGKEMKKRNPSTNTWRVAHNKWMKKGSSSVCCCLEKGMKKN